MKKSDIIKGIETELEITLEAIEEYYLDFLDTTFEPKTTNRMLDCYNEFLEYLGKDEWKLITYGADENYLSESLCYHLRTVKNPNSLN